MSNLKLLDWSITKAQVSPRITTLAKLRNMQDVIVFNGHYPADAMAAQGMIVEKLDLILKELSEI